MANYNKNKTNSFLSVLAVILAMLLIASVVLGLGMHFGGWFSDEEDAEETEQLNEEVADNDGMSVTAVEMDGINVSLKRITSDEESNGEVVALGAVSTSDQYTVTATITPSTATDKNVTMSVAWANASSTWATGKTVTDYVTVTQSSTGSLTGTVTCNQAFGEQVILTVTSEYDSSISATLTIDYVARVSSVTMSIGTTTFKVGQAYTYTLTPNYGTGTLKGTVSYSNLSIQYTGDFTTKVGSYLANYMSSDYSNITLYASQVISTSVASGSSYTFSNYDMYSYNGEEEALTDTYYLNSCYKATNDMGTTTNATLSCIFSYTYSGTTFSSGTSSLSVHLDFSNYVTPVTNVTLNTDSIVF